MNPTLQKQLDFMERLIEDYERGLVQKEPFLSMVRGGFREALDIAFRSGRTSGWDEAFEKIKALEA